MNYITNKMVSPNMLSKVTRIFTLHSQSTVKTAIFIPKSSEVATIFFKSSASNMIRWRNTKPLIKRFIKEKNQVESKSSQKDQKNSLKISFKFAS